MAYVADEIVMNKALDFACPRCNGAVSSAYYGPCVSCRDELKAAFAGRARDVDAVAYEPKMNVVPNQVATKD